MSIVSNEILRLFRQRKAVLITKVVLKSLQSRFKVTKWSLECARPFSINILRIITGFKVKVYTMRSPTITFLLK